MCHKPSEHHSLNKHFVNNTGLHQLKHARDQMEAYNTKQSLITFRKKLLDDQKKTTTPWSMTASEVFWLTQM